jgi:hypothetical protein
VELVEDVTGDQQHVGGVPVDMSHELLEAGELVSLAILVAQAVAKMPIGGVDEG